jgi:hypothetical protein
MSAGIWAVIFELRESNPYAKCESAGLQSLQSQQSGGLLTDAGQQWHVPFHQKVCLWRLVQALFDKGEASADVRGPRGGSGSTQALPQDLAVRSRSSELIGFYEAAELF